MTGRHLGNYHLHPLRTIQLCLSNKLISHSSYSLDLPSHTNLRLVNWEHYCKLVNEMLNLSVKGSLC